MKNLKINEHESECLCGFCKAEWKAIQEHRETLSGATGREVSPEEAIENWRKTRALPWREQEMRRAFEAQRGEMLKHKWIESEKAGCDLGTMAIEDWIKKYAHLWRKWWENTE